MALLEVRTIGDPVLDRKSAEVEVFDAELASFLDDMMETMRVKDGIGLAAPQVGVSKRVVVIELDGVAHEIINPRIVDKRGKEKAVEACLSVPDLSGEVERPSWIRLEYQDRHGQKQELETDGLLARCVQHECDHLDGVLFVNRLAPSARLMLKKRIKELRLATKKRLQQQAASA